MDETSDRISNLPCNVINEILKYLPLHQAVRTSILSSGWRYKWLTIPYLVFDATFEDELSENSNIESIIYQLLLLHKGPIVKFTYDDLKYHPALDHWLHFLSNHPIEELTLNFYSTSIPPMIPHHLFSFGLLTHLCLFNCKLRPPSTFKGFDRLVRLHLFDVLIEPEEFRKFMSKCRMLEQLYLDFRFTDPLVDFNSSTFVGFNTTFVDFEIDAPNLKLFRYWGKPPFVSFKNTPVLEELSIMLVEWETYQGPQTNTIKFVGELSSIKKLKLHYGCLQLLARGGVPQKLLNNLSNLVVLQLHYLNFASIGEVSWAVCLIRSSPNLQSLEITSITSPEGDVKPAAQFFKTEQECKHTLSNLENVKIENFGGLESEMEFVKLLLAAATTLIKLEVKLNYDLQVSAKEESVVVKQLARFCRASSKAEIII